DITSNFTGVSGVAAAGETGFETTITWGEAFEFDPEKNYRFQYSNCLTTDGIPNPGTEFGNSAVFNGAEISGKTTSPNVTENKSGRLNTSAKEVADRKSTRLNSSHVSISYAVFCLKQKIDKKL